MAIKRLTPSLSNTQHSCDSIYIGIRHVVVSHGPLLREILPSDVFQDLPANVDGQLQILRPVAFYTLHAGFAKAFLALVHSRGKSCRVKTSSACP